jgi:hypothetical protein
LAVALAAALFTLLGAMRAQAQSVVVVRPPLTDRVLVEAFHRLRAELGLQAFEVIVVEAPSDADTPASIARLAQENGAFAAISFTRRAGATTADIWIADRATGKTTVRTLALRGVVDAPSVLAVRTVDLLRESLRELDDDEVPAPEIAGVDRRPVPEQVRAWARPDPPPWRLRLEGTALGETRRVGLGYGVGVALLYRLPPRCFAGLGLAGPLIGGSYRATSGRASVRQELGWLELDCEAFRAGPFAFGAALGAGVYHLEARSEVSPPLSSRSDQVTSFALCFGPVLELHATETVAAIVGLSALALSPRPGVAVGLERTLFAQPLIRGYAGMGVGF